MEFLVKQITEVRESGVLKSVSFDVCVHNSISNRGLRITHILKPNELIAYKIAPLVVIRKITLGIAKRLKLRLQQPGPVIQQKTILANRILLEADVDVEEPYPDETGVV